MEELASLIREHGEVLREQFQVTALTVFGSTARHENHEGSDVDMFVDMPPKIYLVIALKQYLEEILGCSVDVVRRHRGLNPQLIKEIERDGINIFRAA